MLPRHAHRGGHLQAGGQLCRLLVSGAAKLWHVKSGGEADFEGGRHRPVILQTAVEDKRGSSKFSVLLSSWNTVHPTMT